MKKKPKKKPVTFLAPKSIPCTMYIGGLSFECNYIDEKKPKINLN